MAEIGCLVRSRHLNDHFEKEAQMVDTPKET